MNNKKLNYLLVMPRLVQNIGDGYSFPLGIAYISSIMKKTGYNVITLNLNHREGNIFEIINQEIKGKRIDVVATGGLSFQYATIRNVIETVKKVNPNIITIVGGGIITSDPIPAMNALEYVDFGVLGEGEITISELCNALEKGKDFTSINGLIYKLAQQYKLTEPRKEIRDLDSLPWPDYEGFELDKYLQVSPSISGINRKNTVFMISSRSCPYLCTFCFHTVGRIYRQRSLDNFFKELEYLISYYKIDFICLADELFSVNAERLNEFCRRIKPYNIKWWAQFRVDTISKNPKLLPMLKDAGCEVMSFGLESADNRILKSMRKDVTIEQTEKALKLVYDEGISMEGAFIFGDIEETKETANNTLKWWSEHSEYKITLNLITIFPGTYLYHYACKNGLIRDKMKFLKEGCPQVNVSKLTNEEFSELVREIMEAPMTLTKTLSKVDIHKLDYNTGRVALGGTCTVCHKTTRWENVKLFSSSFLACEHCGQRYNIMLPPEIRANIERNIRKLLAKYGKIGVWGINYHTTDLFKKSEALKDANVYPIDISEGKRKMDLFGKQIYTPDIIASKGIELVIVPIPSYINEITERIKTEYKNVKVIDVCELVNPDYLNKSAEDSREDDLSIERKKMNNSEAIEFLEKQIQNPSIGLSEDIFLFITRITPMVNVDLLIKDEKGRTLLSWRNDPYHDVGWYIPGGIIRFKERMSDRIQKVAEREIGTKIQFEPDPIAFNEIIMEQKNRSHFVSFLYKCFLPSNFIPENNGLRENDAGYLKWHERCPDNLIKVHNDIYRGYI